MDALDAIGARRSTSRLTEPGPDDHALEMLLAAAAAAPDHGNLRPWHFTILRGEMKKRFGPVLRDAYLARCEESGVSPAPAAAEKEMNRLERAPLVIAAAVIVQKSERIPVEEQRAAVAAACQNILIAATALGYGAIWRTGTTATDPRVRSALGLGPIDSIAGFIYIGTPAEDPGRRGETANADAVARSGRGAWEHASFWTG